MWVTDGTRGTQGAGYSLREERLLTTTSQCKAPRILTSTLRSQQNGHHFANDIFKCNYSRKMYFDSNSTEPCSLGSNCQYIGIDSGNGLDWKLLPEPMLTKMSDAIWHQDEVLALNVRGPSYIGLTRSMSWLLMPWLLTSPTSPGHQQPWYWLYRICRSLSYLRKDSKYLCDINVEEWHKM